VVKLERVQVICPACGQQVEAVATDGRVKGYCAVARQSVDIQIETQLTQVRKGRDSRGRFVKGTVPWNIKVAEQSGAHKQHTAKTRAKIADIE